MSTSETQRPSPAEHKEIAQGSGPAAILMFLQIVIIGYLASVIYYLLKENTAVFWTLVPFSAAYFFYFPAAFALILFLPTNPLTRAVARAAQLVGLIALLMYGAGLISEGLYVNHAHPEPGVITACAVLAGIVGALLLRVLFRFGIRNVEEKIKKNDSETRLPE